MDHRRQLTRSAPGGRIDVAAVVVDLTDVEEIDRDALELLAGLQERGRIRVVGARWPHVRAALLDAPLGEIARLATLTRSLVTAARLP